MALKSVESQNVEFKSNWRDEYLKVICAFANADGGRLIIGVEDKGKSIGLKNTKKLLEDVPNKIKDILGIIPKVTTESKKDKDALIIEVKPSFAPISFEGARTDLNELVEKRILLSKGSGRNVHYVLRQIGDSGDYLAIEEKTPMTLQRRHIDTK